MSDKEEDKVVCKFIKRKRLNIRQPVKEEHKEEKKNEDSDDDENEDQQSENDDNNDDGGGSLLIMKKKPKQTGSLTFKSKKSNRKNYSIDENDFDDDFESRTGESAIFTSFKANKSADRTGPKDMGKFI